jgi:RNA-directed DNA polymerase
MPGAPGPASATDKALECRRTMATSEPAPRSTGTASANIQKRHGKDGQYEVTVPAVADRVVQAALKLVLEPIFEADFKPVSYGFRPRRRAQDAIAEIHFYGTAGYRWVLDADIAACFDEIDHAALMDRVRRRIKDKRVLTPVKAFLKAGLLTELGEPQETLTGTPQGGLCSAEHKPPYA